MARVAKPPHIVLLEAMVDTAKPIDFLDRAGIAVQTVRHLRGRFPVASEGNTITFRWLGNDDRDPEDQYKTSGERVRVMSVDVEIDLTIPPELLNDDDPTGWLYYSNVAAALMEALRDEDTSLIWPGLCDWIVDGDDTPDDDSKPDEGRLVKSAGVVYRVRSDAPNVLLGQGVNA